MSQIRRRQFLTGSGALLVSRLVQGQAPHSERVRTIGTLDPGVDPKGQPSEYPSSKIRAKLGWIEGKNLLVERRFAEHRPERLPELAQELVRKRVELIIAYGEASIAAARATGTIPIVFVNGGFALEFELIESFARPGRNVTGTTIIVPTLGLKRYEFLREIAPAIKRVYLLSPSYGISETVTGKKFDMGAYDLMMAQRLGLEVLRRRIHDAKDIEPALAETLSWGAQALTVGGSPTLVAARYRIAEFALLHRLPSASTSFALPEAGALLSYGPSLATLTTMTERAMEYVDRILRGARPGDLPVEQPLGYELVLNVKTASAMGLKVPRALLVRADRVIQ